ncbi:MAG: hypothetical protein A3K68_00890 [Euryarchaeota archaeon RBG_16_68_13]|nr:MAG: hypothetical protein A3K68_00890 [Euryarchaeota archaeon RBG_16_68_13]
MMAGRGHVGVPAALLLVALAALLLPALPASAEPQLVTLYGDARDGWGNSTTNLTNPGPTIVVNRSEMVRLTLVGNDSLLHNWFIDYDNDLIDDPDEPNSLDFQGNTIPFNFTADRAGNFTYRCRVHPTTMTGRIEIRSVVPRRDFTLYGDARDGWGATNASISNPGYILSVEIGDNVTITLLGNDSTLHNWFIDYDNDFIDDPEEPNSTDFQGSTVVFPFIPDRAGNFTYRCRVHPTTMTGRIEIR